MTKKREKTLKNDEKEGKNKETYWIIEEKQ